MYSREGCGVSRVTERWPLVVIGRTTSESGHMWRMVTCARNCRHATAVWTGRCFGSSDVPLDTSGHERRRFRSSLEVTWRHVGGAFGHSFGASGDWLGYEGERASGLCSSMSQVLDHRVRLLFKAHGKALDRWRSGDHSLNAGHMAASWRPDATVLRSVIMKRHIQSPQRQWGEGAQWLYSWGLSI
jgi:hypothetical protein